MGQDEIKSKCKKKMHTRTMDRGFTVHKYFHMATMLFFPIPKKPLKMLDILKIYITIHTRTVKKIFNWRPLTKRSQRRLKYRWEGNIKQDICQLKIQNWVACVQDRGKWKEVIEKAKTFN
jgi:hypothetical protein